MTWTISHLIDNSGSVFYFWGKQHIICQSVYEQSYIIYRSYLNGFICQFYSSQLLDISRINFLKQFITSLVSNSEHYKCCINKSSAMTSNGCCSPTIDNLLVRHHICYLRRTNSISIFVTRFIYISNIMWWKLQKKKKSKMFW